MILTCSLWSFPSRWLKKYKCGKDAEYWQGRSPLVNFTNSNGTGRNRRELIISVHQKQRKTARPCIAELYFSLLHFLAFSLVSLCSGVHVPQTHHAPTQAFSHLCQMGRLFLSSLNPHRYQPHVAKELSGALSLHKRGHVWPITCWNQVPRPYRMLYFPSECLPMF